MATWSQTHGALQSHPDRPVLVVFGQASSTSITDKLIAHYSLDGPRRWNRLNECLYWFYLDLFFVFTNWNSTLEMARLNLEPKERQLFDQRKNNPIQHQTRELHRDASTSLALQESIRLHHAALKRFQRGVSQLPMSDALELLKFRLDDVAELLDYYDTTANTILEQQKNLLSLTFNIETVMQTQAVARINILAFIFLPLSFVAGIFGMTTISIPVKWYPVAAIPVLVVTLSFAYGINQFTNLLESRSRQRNLQPPHKSSNIWRYISRLLHFRNGQNTQPNEEVLDGDQAHVLNGPTLLVDGGHINRVDMTDLFKSSVALDFRVRGVARVDSNHLAVGKYKDAASGPLFSPSGSLRH